MAEKKYKIKVQGQLIEVSKDVYLAFYQMRRQEQAQRERDAYNHCIQYAALDSEELLGEDILLETGGGGMGWGTVRAQTRMGRKSGL